MYKIFKNQSYLKIQVITGINLTGATCKIKYKKPSQLKGEWDATIVDAQNGTIEYNVTDSSVLDVAGDWKVRSYCIFPDGRAASGQIASFKVYDEE